MIVTISDSLKDSLASIEATDAAPLDALQKLWIPPALDKGISHGSFSVAGDARESFALWQASVAEVFDLAPVEALDGKRFDASASRYIVDDLALFDIHNAPNIGVRSVAKLSTDSFCDVTFHIFPDGKPSVFVDDDVRTTPSRSENVPAIIALDQGQPSAVRSFQSRMLVVAAPRAMIEASFPDASALHGRIVYADTPLARLAIEHILALRSQVVGLGRDTMRLRMLTAISLLTSLFNEDAGLSGNSRGSVRAAMLEKIRRFVEANLHDPKMTPESLLTSLGLPRATVYRLFEHVGGLAAYIRNRRLLTAAVELVRFQDREVQEIAWGLGFTSLSSFTRAFTRYFNLAPRELRKHAPEIKQNHNRLTHFW